MIGLQAEMARLREGGTWVAPPGLARLPRFDGRAGEDREHRRRQPILVPEEGNAVSAESKGFITDCYIHVRRPEPAAVVEVRSDGVVVAMLDRYAIVPLEVFDPAHPDHESMLRNCREVMAEKCPLDGSAKP